MFNLIGTKKYGVFQKILNSTHMQGRTANMFAKRLTRENYKANMYYREFAGDAFALSGTDTLGNTKTYLITPGEYYTKTNTIISKGNGEYKRIVDKGTFNTHDGEICGKTTEINIKNNKIVDKKETERGWFTFLKNIK